MGREQAGLLNPGRGDHSYAARRETMVAAGSGTFKRLTTKEQIDELASRAKNVSLRNELMNDRENIKEVRVFVDVGGVELADIFYNDGARALHGVDGEDALCVG
jgi:hypothetical protein